MFAIEFSPARIPDWVNRVALPKYPTMPLAGYVLLGLGGFVLLIGYFIPIEKIRSLLAGLTLTAYYPLAYLTHWLLFRYDEKERAVREANKFEDFLFHHTYVLDWSVLGTCASIGLFLLSWMSWATLRKRKRTSTDNPAPVEPPIRPRAAAAPPAPRKVAKKPSAPPPSDNPFKFG
jgi:hypothetical protein